MNLLETLNFVNQNVLNVSLMRLHIFGGGRSLFFDYLLSFTSALPDIGQKVSKLAYKLPVFGNI